MRELWSSKERELSEMFLLLHASVLLQNHRYFAIYSNMLLTYHPQERKYPTQIHLPTEHSMFFLIFIKFMTIFLLFFFNFFFFFYCSGFCHTLKWNSHGFTCAPHPYRPSHLPLNPIPLGLPSAPGLSACLMF